MLAACGSSGGGSGSGSSGGGAGKGGKAVSKAQLTVVPKNDAANVSFKDPVKVTVKQGKLGTVTVKDDAGNALSGKVSADGLSWTSGEPTAGAKYTVHATAKDTDGLEAVLDSSFTTLAKANTLIGYYTPDDNKTVGVGMPVSINFNRPVTDKKAVQAAITVTAAPGVEIVGHWFGDQRLDFRPENYWAAGTKVSVKMRLKGVQAAKGVYGYQEKDVSFTIARSQVSTVDASSHQMTVVRDGKTIKTIPISAGSPEHTTYNGQMVISEQFKQTRMNGSTVGFGGEYDIPDVPHAQRLTTSGTFVHGNYWGSPAIFGSQNTSHGCVGLRDAKGAGDPSTPAAWFYDNSMVGDVVIIKNSNDTTVAPDNGLNGWNMAWAQWKAGSAA
nr:Ig-like domain-containing protein [Mangrovactinospora gilvigrisea]